LLGYRQAVRHQVLILAFPGSNPGIPANFFYQRVLLKNNSVMSINIKLYAGVAELVDALDLGSSILGCESSSLSFRTTFLIRTKTIKYFFVGISPSGKAPGFDPGIPRFKSWYPSQLLLPKNVAKE
jgi:hypothetical protein